MRRIKNQKINRNEARKRERESQNKRMRRIKNQKIHRNEALPCFISINLLILDSFHSSILNLSLTIFASFL